MLQFEEFCLNVFPDFKVKKLQKFFFKAVEKYNKITVYSGHRTGKTLLTTILYPAYYLGINPNSKVLVCSTSGDSTFKFFDIINSSKYKEIFPEFKLKSNSYIEIKNNSPTYGKSCDLLVLESDDYQSTPLPSGNEDWVNRCLLTRLNYNGKFIRVTNEPFILGE